LEKKLRYLDQLIKLLRAQQERQQTNMTKWKGKLTALQQQKIFQRTFMGTIQDQTDEFFQSQKAELLSIDAEYVQKETELDELKKSMKSLEQQR
jgi:hypothetical protein